MKGKIIAWLIIGFIGVPLLLFFGTALILFLSPGTEIFGIRYVAYGVCDFKDQKTVDMVNGNIYIDSFDVPVFVEYTSIPNIQVSFKQEFVGFTNTREKNQQFKNINYWVKEIYFCIKDIWQLLFNNKIAECL